MINPVAFSVFGHDIRWYGIIIALGLFLGIILAMYHAKREGHDPDWILDLCLIVVPLAVIGARIYYVLLNWNLDYAGTSFWNVFAVWKGGLGIYGAVIGGFIGVWLYTRFVNKKIRFISLLDILVPSLILGQAIGRWGNFCNQEAYGYAITNPAWQWFPAGVFINNPVVTNGVTVTQMPAGWFMATFFYESIWNFLVFGFLFFYLKNNKTKRPGNVFWFYLMLYGLGRVVIEGLRTDSLYIHGTSIRVSQWLSGLLVIVAAIVLLWPRLSPTLSPILAPIGKKLKSFFARIPAFFVNVFKSIKANHEAAMNEPLADSLKLCPDVEEAKEPVKTDEAAAPAKDKHLTVDETVAGLVVEETPDGNTDKKEG